MLRGASSVECPLWASTLRSSWNGEQRTQASRRASPVNLRGERFASLACSAAGAGVVGVEVYWKTRRREAVNRRWAARGRYPTAVARGSLRSSLQPDSPGRPDEAAGRDNAAEWEDEEFGTYRCLGTHREMIEDASRTEAFREAIFATCKGKKVLEVGCGTGILSAFAAQAGATSVVAVEADAEMAQYAREVMAHNGLNAVVVLEGMVEDCQDQVDLALISEDPFALPRVDVLISEWMGFMLVCEDMFPSVAFARDRWLRPGGMILPMECSVWAAPVYMRDHLNSVTGFWMQSHYGVDLSPLAHRALEQHTNEPVVVTCSSNVLLSKPLRLWTMDCQRASGEDARFQNLRFQCEIDRDGVLQGLVLWFRCKLIDGVEFGTGPMDAPTHWEQIVAFLDAAELKRADTAVSSGSSLQGAFQWTAVGDTLDVRMAGEVQQDATEQGGAAFRFARRLVLQITP